MKSPSLAVVILNYNHPEDVIECVASIDREAHENVTVIIVDNASTNDSVERLREAIPQHTLLECERNDGFSAGTNVGIRRALKDGHEWVLCLNPDTTVEKGFFESFFSFVTSRTDVRAVGATGYYYSEPDKIWFAGGYFDWFKARGECYLQGETRDRLPTPKEPRRCSFLTCACLFVHREAIEKIGLLDERYFLGGEEWDYSRRLTRAGFDLWVLGDCSYRHKVTATHVKYSPKYIYNGYRTKLMFMQTEKPLTYVLWAQVFKAFTRFVSIPKFVRLDPDLAGKEPEIHRAIHTAFQDHRRYRSLELAHLEQFPF